MIIDIKVMLKDESGQPFMGIGLVWLLAGIDEHHSISQAAKQMDLSYPKALRMLQSVERGLGHPVVARHRGGSERGGAELTPLGRDFLRRYDGMQKRIKRFAAEEFKKTFAKPLASGGAD
ncbi:MAG TPA: ModE family transcriptional regulator [Myxococcales bacterium]|nr:ModE family transcriptional regulator [Myxococcales bacterium]